jgi:hypothetical protein
MDDWQLYGLSAGYFGTVRQAGAIRSLALQAGTQVVSPEGLPEHKSLNNLEGEPG